MPCKPGAMMLIKLFLIFFVTISNVRGECGYKSCHPIKEDVINIHLVPHSHDDLGWLKTFEQYYYGSHNNINNGGVQYVLSSIVGALEDNADRRFIYVETGFFWKWWLEQDEKMQNRVKALVNNGQLEFIGGGWSMNDEATVYYQTTIDQMTLGLKKLNDTFGECGHPKVGWQIDPFGHSREMASIFAQMGLDGFFLNRIDYEDQAKRTSTGEMEFVWRGSPDYLGESSDIFTNVLYRHYSAPSGLCFDIFCNDEPIIDSPESPEYNVKQKAEDFVNNWIVPAKSSYSSNNILVPMGDDFQYQYAGKNFLNMDKLISYMNSRDFNGTKYNVIYSTPSCYLNAVYQSTNGTLNTAVKTDDFFPYGSAPYNYWTGYYTSRPTGKGYSKFSNNFLQVIKQLSVLANLHSDEDSAKIETLKEALGVFQHHDAITGTDREAVAHDYIHLLHKGIAQGEELANSALASLVQSSDSDFTTCHMLNISECATTEEANTLVITIYNPLARNVTKYIRIPIKDNASEIIITDPEGVEVVTQMLPIHQQVLKVPGRNSTALYELAFRAENIPALGFKSYFYQKNERQARYPQEQSKLNSVDITKLAAVFEFDYMFYTGFVGTNGSIEASSSTHYAFRPDPTKGVQSLLSGCPSELFVGTLYSEFHFNCSTEWLSCVWRIFPEEEMSEFVHLVGPLPYIDGHGVEVIFRMETSLEYDDKIYTDLNGRESLQRIRNFRPTFNLTVSEPESGNYYPIVRGISIQNENESVTILNDRPQGGGSIKYQQIEFLIHRNTNTTGDGGAGEPLNEQAYDTGVVSRGSHFVLLNANLAKEFAQQIRLDSWIFFSLPKESSFNDYKHNHVMQYSGLFSDIKLPRNIHLLTLEPWSTSTILLRLENFVGLEDLLNYGPSTVNIQELFSAFKVVSLRQTNLSANRWLEDVDRIMFNHNGKKELNRLRNYQDFNVTLQPMEIITFIVEISY